MKATQAKVCMLNLNEKWLVINLFSYSKADLVEPANVIFEAFIATGIPPEYNLKNLVTLEFLSSIQKLKIFLVIVSNSLD